MSFFVSFVEHEWHMMNIVGVLVLVVLFNMGLTDAT